jgi:catechol 2,3-dioxygenase-like lactoylglutathione lyase family enzyme
VLQSFNVVGFVPITNATKAREFYEGILGLRFVKDDGFASVFDANGIMIRAAKMNEVKPAQFTILGWQVPEIESVVRSLKAKGFPSKSLISSSKTTLPSGLRPAAIRSPGLKTRTEMFCQFHSTFSVRAPSPTEHSSH